MKAARIAGFGDPRVLQLVDCDAPQAGDGEVIVELRAAAVNWHDCLVRQGVYPTVPRPLTLGADGAGVRRDTGEEVIIFPSLRWGADERHPKEEFEILGDFADGTYAEQVVVPEENAFPLPAGWSWTEAASLGLAGATAYRAMFSRGALAAGETVLVLGAGSGVSTIAVALARMAGARVLVTSSSPEKLARAAELGAGGGALYTEEDWPEQIRELAGGPGVDLVVDSAGATWPQSLSVLAPGGRLVSFGASAGAEAAVPVRPFYFGQFSILGTTMASPADFAGLLELIKREPGWRPAIDSVRPLAQAAEAHARLERREQFGKLVLTIGDD